MSASRRRPAFKILLAGLILHEAQAGKLALEDTVSLEGIEIQPHSPLVGQLDGRAPVSLVTLCQAPWS